MKTARFRMKSFLTFIVIVAVLIFAYYLMQNQWDVQSAVQDMLSLFSKS